MLNIRKLFKANWIVALVFGLVMSMTTILFSGFSNKLFDMNHVYSCSSYDASGYLPRDTFADKNSYYSNLSYVSLSSDNKIISTNTLMCKNDVNYCNTHFVNINGEQIVDRGLLDADCSLSKNTAEHYSLKIGDTIKVKTIASYDFTIKYIFDNFYGFDEPNYFGDEYLIILGENTDLINSLQSYNTYVLADKNFVFGSSGMLNSRHNTLTKIRTYNALIYSGFSFLVIVSLIITLLFFSNDIDNDLKYHYINGFKKKTAIKGIFINSFNKWFWMFVPSILVYSIVTLFISSFSWPIFSFLILSMFLCSICSFVIFAILFAKLNKRRAL